MRTPTTIHSRGISALTAVALLAGLFSGVVSPATAAPGDVTRVSVDSSGIQGNNSSKRASSSGDGRFIAFESDASNLVIGDTGIGTDIFVRDRQTGETTRVSVTASGAEANEGSGGAAISGDGRYVAFVSDASNLVANDTNSTTDIFVRDRQTGTTIRISVSSSGEQANDFSDFPLSISSDGRFVAFNSDATNLVGNDTNGVTDIFVHDNQTGVTERVSVASDGTQANATSFVPSISANGQFVVFTSRATNLVSGDTNNGPDIFVRDRQAGTTTRVSINSSGLEANQGALDGSISADGRYVAFSSSSSNLMSEETSGLDYVYIHDRQTGTTTLVSVFSDGFLMVGRSHTPSMSFDGRYVAFAFDDRSDGQALQDIYVRDRQTGATIRATNGGTGGEDSSFGPAISSDGRVVAFWSLSSRLVPGDTNGTADAFVYEVGSAPDLINPTVVSTAPLCGTGCSFPSSSSVSFRVVFSEAVSGVTVDDFALTTGGGISGASLTDVSGTNSEYAVTVNTGTGEGNLRLDVIDNDSIQDIALNPLGGIGAGNGNFTTGELYVIDKNIPIVTGIVRTDASPTASDSVHFIVNFSEPISGIDSGDFALTITGGISGAALTEVSGFGNTYTVTVITGTGDGTLRLDLLDNDSIVDQVNNPLGGIGVGNGNFIPGDVYTINKNAPIVTSILRADPNPTTSGSVRFTIFFSEVVSGVDVGDFALASTGNVVGASIAGMDGSGTIYTVTVGTGTGNGALRLNLMDNDSIVDALGLPLGGAGVGNGNFGVGEEYTINKAFITILTETFGSNGTNDGWILESSEDSNQGGIKNVNDAVFRLGDDAQDRQYRAILHFPTYYLPDNAVVTEAILLIKIQGAVGTDPFTTHQNISIDIRNGVFGNFGPFGIKALQASDFQNPASMNSAGLIPNNSISGWYVTTLNSAANQFINLTGMTQLRLAFQLDDNDDLGDDYLAFYSGNHDTFSARPHLVIKYYIPK